MSAIAILHKAEIIELVSQGEMLDKIAAQIGIAAPNISKHLARDAEYKEARELGAELRLERSRHSIAEIAELGVVDGMIVGLTQEQGNLARVRESRLRADQWFAEREFPHRWGKQPDVLIQQISHIDGGLESLSQTILDRLNTVAAQQQIEDKQGNDIK